jgi:flagellar basal-body rod protein FlgC
MDAISIAASGMLAASRRLEVSAANVANMRTTGRLPPAGGGANTGANAAAGTGAGTAPTPYTPLRVDQVDTAGGATAANVSTVSPSYTPSYDPTASFADRNGMVAAPNVDLVNEAVQQILAKYTFAASAAIMRAASDMSKTLLDRTI